MPHREYAARAIVATTWVLAIMMMVVAAAVVTATATTTTTRTTPTTALLARRHGAPPLTFTAPYPTQEPSAGTSREVAGDEQQQLTPPAVTGTTLWHASVLFSDDRWATQIDDFVNEATKDPTNPK